MAVSGWKLDVRDRAALIDRVLPIWADVIADHVTLEADVGEESDPPAKVNGQIVGQADDGRGVQALVVATDGSTRRPRDYGREVYGYYGVNYSF